MPDHPVKFIVSSNDEFQKEATATRSNGNSSTTLLSPQIHRLLRLLQEETTSSASSSCATTRLIMMSEETTSIMTTQQRWELLGHLQALLSSRQWKTRTRAAAAMQGVAARVPPPTITKPVLAHLAHLQMMTVEQVDVHRLLLLPDHHLLMAHTNPYTSSSRSEHEDDEEDDSEDDDDEDLPLEASKRIHRQQQILTRRLGLSGLAEILGRGEIEEAEMLLMTKEDVHVEETTHTPSIRRRRSETKASAAERRQQHLERIKKKQRRSENETGVMTSDAMEDNNTLRALLHYASSSSSSFSNGNENPQIVLSVDLLYRMLDPCWHVRHGALLGTLALLRSWWWSKMPPHQHQQQEQRPRQETMAYGVWLNNVLATCLCVLALDRFGDFSGAILVADHDKEEEEPSLSVLLAAAVVAPVREMAGQVLAVVWFRAPLQVQNQTLEHLWSMRSCEKIWEVRHAALIAFTYMTSLLLPNNKGCPTRIRGEDCDERVIRMVLSAVEALQDDSDDVKSVAAKLLHSYFHWSHSRGRECDLETLVIPKLWTALLKAESYSSCLVDLVSLLSLFVQQDCSRFLRLLEGTTDSITCKSTAVEVFAQTLVRLLDCEYESVKVAVFHCVQSLAGPLASHCAASGDCSAYMILIERLFDTFFEVSSETSGSKDYLLNACRARCAAWKELAAYCATVCTHSDARWTKGMESLVYLYFGLNITNHARSIDLFGSLLDAADAFAMLLRTVGCGGEDNLALLPIIEISLFSFLRSPWPSQCEAACLLISSLALLQHGWSKNSYSSLSTVAIAWPEGLSSTLHDLILGVSRPTCLVVDPLRSPTLEDAAVIRLCEDAFLRVASLLGSCNKSCTHLSDSIVELWNKAVRARAGSDELPLNVVETASAQSMRVHASIAGAVLAVGLPAKITPVVRALMTSLKNERSPARLDWTIQGLCTLLLAIEGKPQFSSAHEKILDAVCNMASIEEPTLMENPCPSSGSQVVTMYVSRVIEAKALRDLGPIWSRISPLLVCGADSDNESLVLSAKMLSIAGAGLRHCDEKTLQEIELLIACLTKLACERDHNGLRTRCLAAIRVLYSVDQTRTLTVALTTLFPFLNDLEFTSHRSKACILLEAIVTEADEAICPFVKALLPLVLSLMTDSVEECARRANKTFATLVRMAPLVQDHRSVSVGAIASVEGESVIDHLISGKPLPDCVLPPAIETSLRRGSVVLRQYQREGVAWLRFLQTMNLNGALCDSMGLGKTLQALIGIALSHYEADQSRKTGNERSLIVCPSTLVGHWMTEIAKYFPGNEVFQPLCYIGNKSQRTSLWLGMEASINVIVTSYAVLRSDIDVLAKNPWRTCVLDEGHLLKNPKTATARASRRIIARHRFILTGTPVENRVQELWAVFDFLMPNFLGSSTSFAKEFARPILKSQLPGAKASAVAEGLDRLKTLHQQVLPFILRREKSEVLQELPPKVVSYIKVPMSDVQARLYRGICSSSRVQASLKKFDHALEPPQEPKAISSVDNDALKSLLLLRLLCTHPILVAKDGIPVNGKSDLYNLDVSGKLLALVDMLRNADIDGSGVTAADNDTSLLYCDDAGEYDLAGAFSEVVDSAEDAGIGPENAARPAGSTKKCIVFAQFTKTLDLVEELVFKSLMPSLRYVRLDGRVPAEKRSELANRFNCDPSIKVFLATTRVGGLGLNLTGADTVFFLENDFNPFVDIQAQDRAHRIGQSKCVNIYNFVTDNSIEEKILNLQRKKIAISEAIVNSENSSMYSMGTDRLLDIFTSRSSVDRTSAEDDSVLDIDALVEQHSEDYASLSVDEFLRDLSSSEDTSMPFGK